MQTRRTFIKLVAAGSAVVGSGILLPRLSFAKSTHADGLFAGLKQVDRWTIVEVGETRGTIPVLMQAQDGSRFLVEIAARDPEGPRGVAETEKLALYLSNGGSGHTATVEEHGLGVMALAAELRRREAHCSVQLRKLRLA